jgi:uncharacterized membrane protein YbhN (UPF0104 family)
VTHWPTLRQALQADWRHLAATGLLIVVTWALMSVQSTLLLRSVGCPVGYGEHFLLQLASILANYLPLRLGPVLRIHYLRSLHGLPVAHFGSLLAVRAVLLMLACGVTGGLAEWIGGRFGEPASSELRWIFLGLTAAAAAALLLPLPRFSSRQGALAAMWRKLAEGIVLARARLRLMVLVFFLLELQIAIVALRLGITYDAVDFSASPTLAVKVACLAVLVNLLAFTMGSLGLREAVIGYATEASGQSFSTGVFASVVDRAMLIGLTYPLGLLGLLYVRRRLRQQNPESKLFGTSSSEPSAKELSG